MHKSMENEIMENETPENVEEEVIESEETTETVDEPDYDTLKEQNEALEKSNKTLQAQKLHFKNKAEKKAEANKKPDNLSKEDLSSDSEWREKMELKVKGYNEKQIAHIMKNGGTIALEDPLVMAGIIADKQQQKAEEATTKETGTGAGAFRQVTDAQLKKMTSTEMEEKLSG